MHCLSAPVTCCQKGPHGNGQEGAALRGVTLLSSRPGGHVAIPALTACMCAGHHVHKLVLMPHGLSAARVVPAMMERLSTALSCFLALRDFRLYGLAHQLLDTSALIRALPRWVKTSTSPGTGGAFKQGNMH